MPNLYATVKQFRTHLGIDDAEDDERLIRILDAVSRQIDQHCERRFYVEQRTRVYTARRGDRVRIDDLLAVTTLKTDEDGDRTYEDTWTATDYDLDPANALFESPAQPYTRLSVTPDGDYRFPAGVARGVQVVGKWGYYEVLQTSSATLSEALDTTETGVDVSDRTLFSAGHTILIDSEQMYVSSIGTQSLTVERGVNGTTAATHTSGATIKLYSYPVVNEACLYQAALDKLGGANPGGLAGGGDFEQPIRAGGLHPFVQRMLDRFKRVEAA